MSLRRPVPETSLKLWTRSASSVEADFGIFQVERHAMLDGAGKPRRAVHTFTCPDWCNVIAITPARELVMIWQYRFGTHAMSLEVPGGVIDPGEDPLTAAQRELREESGFRAERWSQLSVVEPNPALQNNRCFTFLAEGAHRAHETNFDDLEEIETVLVPVADLPDVLDAGQITHVLCLSAVETYLRRHTR
jgi:8-oxo-dGTP pyrophosphatase MutT (NUDIX family)